jgi:two-component system CheB/CheR fusion protein
MRVIHTHSGDTGLQQRMHALVERQVRHMMLMVADLLDVSQIASRRPRLQAKRVDLCVIVCNAIATAWWDIEQRKHRLTRSCPDCPIWLNADARQLEQVFVNLLINGSKYMDAGGELALSVQVQDGSAVVSVRDRGIGIAPNVLPHIFDLFVRADEAASRSRRGLGVGLALVRMIVDLHGGSVSGVSAGLGYGSEFTVRLPLQS